MNIKKKPNQKNGRKNSGRKKTEPAKSVSPSAQPRAAESAGNGVPEEFGGPAFQRALRYWYREGFEELELARHYAMILLIRKELVFQKIEQAFEDQPLLISIPPDAPDNQKRIDAYLSYIAKATESLNSAVALVMSLQPTEI